MSKFDSAPSARVKEKSQKQISSMDLLTDVSWIDPEHRHDCRVYFLEKYGQYHEEGVTRNQLP